MTPPTPAPGRVERARAKAARARRRRPLSLDSIVDVALRIVDEEGTEAVSMRRVAAEFDTGPASLYAYVANKEELLRCVLERIIEEIVVPEGDTWQEVVRGFAFQTRRIFQRHGDAARLSFAHIPSGNAMLEGTERVLGAMIEGGVPDKVAAWSLDILALYVAADAFEGWLMQQRFDDGSGRDPEEVSAEFVDEVHATFAAMPADRFPYLARTTGVMMAGSSDERFGFGIDMLIAGFAAQVPGDVPTRKRRAMTYPDPVYHGTDGEQSASIRRTDAPHDLEYRNGGTVDYLATGGTTSGAFGLYRWNFGTGRTGPDPHFHRTISESFFILDGTVTIYDGSDWVETRAGDFAHVPPGGIHGFRNESGERPRRCCCCSRRGRRGRSTSRR